MRMILFVAMVALGCSIAHAGTRPGDINVDSRIDISDAVRVLQFAVGRITPTEDELLVADVAPAGFADEQHPDWRIVRGDGRISVADVVLLLRASTGLDNLHWRTQQVAITTTVETLETSGFAAAIEGLDSVEVIGGFTAWSSEPDIYRDGTALVVEADWPTLELACDRGALWVFYSARDAIPSESLDLSLATYRDSGGTLRDASGLVRLVCHGEMVEPACTDGDVDNDGVPDETDNCLWGYNPSQQDTDGDGRGDGGFCDNCPTVPDVPQDDFDRDGLGDACEGPVYNTDPLNRDTDDDGASDGVEGWAWKDCANPRVADTDQDGWSDGQEINFYDTVPCVADVDLNGNGIPDASPLDSGG